MPLEKFWNGKISGIFAALWYFAVAARRRMTRSMASFFQCSRLGRHGRGCRIGRNVSLTYPGRIEFGDNVLIGDDVFICGTSRGSCKLADGVHVDRLTRLDFSGKLSIGRNSTISEGVTIETHTHGHDPRLYVKAVKLEIGERVWIGMRALILPQVGTIGDGAIVGAGAVVTKPVPPFAIVTGVPAVVVGTTKNRDQ